VKPAILIRPEVLRQLGFPDYERAVVGIGNLEASILTTAVLVDLDIPRIWAKANSRQRGQILQRVGAHHVVLPEHDMGKRAVLLSFGRAQGQRHGPGHPLAVS
jgi:trk system potassium uptake protein